MMMTGGKKRCYPEMFWFPPQSCVFDFVNLRASAENVDLNGCIVVSVQEMWIHSSLFQVVYNVIGNNTNR